MKILAPNKKYNGISAGINFVNGIGETDDTDRINWFKENGYSVEAIPTDEIEISTPELENMTAEENAFPVPELENMTAEDLIAFAASNNINIGKSTSKESIIKKIIAAGQPVDGGDPDGTEG